MSDSSFVSKEQIQTAIDTLSEGGKRDLKALFNSVRKRPFLLLNLQKLIIDSYSDGSQVDFPAEFEEWVKELIFREN